MDKGYYELLVPGGANKGAKIGKIVLIPLCIIFLALSFLMATVFILPALAAGVGAYFCSLYTDVEYEYLFLERELSIDKVFNKERRKHAETLSVDKAEVFAPEKSTKFDRFGNGEGKKVTDYSSGDTENGLKKFVMYYEGNRKILFSLDEDMIKAFKSKCPRIFSEY